MLSKLITYRPPLLSGPVYQNDAKYNYNEVMKQAETLSNLSGPIYLDKNERHNYDGFMKQIESIKALASPVYFSAEDASHSFKEVLKCADRIKTMTGE